MKVTTVLLPALLAMGGVIINCGSSDGTKPITGGAGAANTGAGTGGAPVGSGGSGGSTTGGSSGDGTGGAKCVPGSLKDPDTGMCVCRPATNKLCSDGCYDTANDPDHCGDCTAKCEATQVCGASKCSATPKAVVPAAAGCGTLRLAISGSTLYWTDETHGTVQSVATAGGAATSVATAQMKPGLIAVNGTTAYWVNSGDKTIMKAGSATPLVTGKTGIGGITLSTDGKTLYFADGVTINSISTTATDGKSTLIGKEDSGIPHALAVENDNIAYPTELNGDVDVMKITAQGDSVCASEDSTTATNKGCTRLSRSQTPYFDAMYLIGGKAYWTNQTAVEVQDITATSADAVATAGGQALKITAFSISNSAAFFAADDGYIYTSPLTTGSMALAVARTASPGATSVVADATNVYFATPDCAINSQPIPK